VPLPIPRKPAAAQLLFPEKRLCRDLCSPVLHPFSISRNRHLSGQSESKAFVFGRKEGSDLQDKECERGDYEVATKHCRVL
jgi:hypothetical protein